MSIRATSTRIATVAVLAAGGILGGTGVAAAATAPSCIHTRVDTGTITKSIWAHNTCAGTQRFRFILARHTDSDCYTIAHDGWRGIQVARSAALTRLDSC